MPRAGRGWRATEPTGSQPNRVFPASGACRTACAAKRAVRTKPGGFVGRRLAQVGARRAGAGRGSVWAGWQSWLAQPWRVCHLPVLLLVLRRLLQPREPAHPPRNHVTPVHVMPPSPHSRAATCMSVTSALPRAARTDPIPYSYHHHHHHQENLEPESPVLIPPQAFKRDLGTSD